MKQYLISINATTRKSKSNSTVRNILVTSEVAPPDDIAESINNEINEICSKGYLRELTMSVKIVNKGE